MDAMSILVLWLLFTLSVAKNCERLKATLTYTQEAAPRDLSGLLPVVVERINQVLEGVVDVEVEWGGGDLHGRVGEHAVQCRVTRLASVISREAATEIFTDEEGREVTTQCFLVPFTIRDTNECSLPKGNPMRHRCQHPAICINTIGSYECVCPRLEKEANPSGTADEDLWTRLASEERGPWERSFNITSRTSCPSMATTHGCCPERAHTKDGASCRAAFRCPVDPCASHAVNDCAEAATCVRKETPLRDPNYECRCPAGLMGNGYKCRAGIDPKPEPKVMFDGVTPTEETIKNNYYCGCTKPVIDACAGFPPCKGKHETCTLTAGNIPKCSCKPGYVLHEVYGCVDESPPLLRLKNNPNGDGILRLSQGDIYKEYAVDIIDDNAEEYLRSLKITYSQPLPSGCLTKIGEFHVNYTVATPWTSPPFVRITRRVIVEDIDECSIDVATFEKSCPELIPRCDTEAGATCINTIGSYTCKCPKFTSGDGFLPNLSFESGFVPKGYKGGTGCRDTSKPVINLVGPNPKIFRVCACSGIVGVMGDKKRANDAGLRQQQQRFYGDDIKDLIRASSGAELCATHQNANPKSHDCVNAYDETYKGRVDLSRQVVIGEPVQKSLLVWSVPYDVKDEAGNVAETVWRDVVVEEVELHEMETKIRNEVAKTRQQEIQHAIEEDRKKRGGGSTTTRTHSISKTCPTCPPCDSSGDSLEVTCEAFCDAQRESCAINDYSLVIRFLLRMEKLFPPYLAATLLVSAVFVFIIIVSRWAILFIFSPAAYNRGYSSYGEIDRVIQNSVRYHGDGMGPLSQSSSGQPPSDSSMARTYQDEFYSPRSPDIFSPSPSRQNGPMQHGANHIADILDTQPIITPSARGDVRRRTPFASREGYC